MAGSLSDAIRRQAAKDLGRQGVPPTDVNIAERAAVGGYKDDTDLTPTPAGAASNDLGVGGPHSDIADRLTREAAQKLRQGQQSGPPAALLKAFRKQMGGDQ